MRVSGRQCRHRFRLNRNKRQSKRKKSLHFCSSTGGTISAYFFSISGVLV